MGMTFEQKIASEQEDLRQRDAADAAASREASLASSPEAKADLARRFREREQEEEAEKARRKAELKRQAEPPAIKNWRSVLFQEAIAIRAEADSKPIIAAAEKAKAAYSKAKAARQKHEYACLLKAEAEAEAAYSKAATLAREAAQAAERAAQRADIGPIRRREMEREAIAAGFAADVQA